MVIFLNFLRIFRYSEWGSGWLGEREEGGRRRRGRGREGRSKGEGGGGKGREWLIRIVNGQGKEVDNDGEGKMRG